MMQKVRKVKDMKIIKKIFKPFLALFKVLYKVVDKIIVTPLSRLVYRVHDYVKSHGTGIERILNRPNALIIISLICAIVMFVLVDQKVISLTEKEAEVLTGQPINIVYNKEAYVVEGVPETVDITLIGSKSTVYLATQLGDQEVTLDLSKYGPGTWKVKLKYNHSVNNVSYKLDPSTITVKISEKVSKTSSLTYNLLNENSLDSKLSISNVELDNNKVIVKSSQEILNKVAVVKALVDASDITLKESGEFTIDNAPLVAYDSNGKLLENVEMVPSSVSAKVTIDSYHATKDVKVVTNGTMSSGKAISSLTTSIKTVEVYGDKATVDALQYVEAAINVEGLDSNKTLSVNLTQPVGIRYMSETKTNVEVVVGTEANKTISGVQVRTTNLASGYVANAATTEDQYIDVIVKGVESVINGIEASDITAYVDLSGLKTGTHTVPVKVSVNDSLINAQTAKTEITVKITEQK
jgi:YbbR domain-containing protein